MPAAPPAYQPRPKMFAAKFIRLLAKACVANDLGPEAMTLLCVIVATEDARGYRSAVSFWNCQLLPLAGIRSESTLKRIRAKCEQAGWLVCIPGSRKTAPKYWVTIPPQHAGWDDAATDDGADPCDLENATVADAVTPEEAVPAEQSAQIPLTNPPSDGRHVSGIGAASERQVSEMRATSIPIPIPKDPPTPHSRDAEKTVQMIRPPSLGEILDHWQSKPTLPRVAAIDPMWGRYLDARLHDPGFIDNWRPAIDAIAVTPNECGQNSNGWRMSFDYFIKGKGYIKGVNLAANLPPPEPPPVRLTPADVDRDLNDHLPPWTPGVTAGGLAG